ncbi:DUF305 domain-containing protein [Rhodococcus maanshanensis]|uniref:DUF305 domain-containing protein n=1 Tax=Rhodococcus maanshanensis TaxID=183556 RepID=UPI0022B2E4E7|nr:DUF305 domain-containing protein [Rhodococcus maanshanensis]MCZ4557667.1 DUF305 domain-containing protein [Rhodococcus maanshanensis]
MTKATCIRVAALGAAALLFLALGAALRPLVIDEPQVSTTVLNDTEIGFIQDMAGHHQQALMMVQRLDPGIDPGVARLAQQIGDAQRIEVGTLMGWLRLAGVTAANPAPMAWMGAAHETGGAHTHRATVPPADPPADQPAALMPGMATTAELDALATARGRDAETLFLQLMQRHHLGGIAMAQAADHLLDEGPVKQTARSMILEQGSETGLMTALLDQRGAQPLG